MKLQKLVNKILILAGAGLTLISTANASVISLNFEGITAGQSAAIGNFYNGGTSSDGLSGVNYGIEFSSNALGLCLQTPGSQCGYNTSHGGVGVPGSEKGGLFFLSGNQTFMNVAAGFDTGFALNYAAITYSGSISIWSGADGTGTLLANLSLPLTSTNCPGYGVDYCPFESTGVTFGGVAHSVAFAGVGNFIVFDDVTFGSASTPPVGSVPEPETYAMLLAGLGLMGAVARRRQKQA